LFFDVRPESRRTGIAFCGFHFPLAQPGENYRRDNQNGGAAIIRSGDVATDAVRRAGFCGKF
jgi:hypothetical protein